MRKLPNKGVAILSEGITNRTGVMRGRDVEFELRGEVSPKVLNVLVKIAEINHTNMKAIAELATMLDQTVNVIQKFSDVAENMKTRTDQMARAMNQGMEPMEGETEN